MVREFCHLYEQDAHVYTNESTEGARSILHVAAARLGALFAWGEDTRLWIRIVTDCLTNERDPPEEQQPDNWISGAYDWYLTTPLGLFLNAAFCIVRSAEYVKPWYRLPYHEERRQFFLMPMVTRRWIDKALQF